MDKLIDGYFDNINVYAPLLHKPTLQNKIKDGLHLRDGLFGGIVLLVCANGARWQQFSPQLKYLSPGTTAGGRRARTTAAWEGNNRTIEEPGEKEKWKHTGREE